MVQLGNKKVMKELNKNEIYSLDGLSDEQLEVLLKWLKDNDTDWLSCELDEMLENREYYCIFFNETNFEWVEKSFKKAINALELFEEEEKPSQYKIGIDTFKRCESNMTKDEILACCKFNIDKYNWRKKGQDKEDFEKIINYAKWALEQFK